jgi:hypothetical protein
MQISMDELQMQISMDELLLPAAGGRLWDDPLQRAQFG